MVKRCLVGYLVLAMFLIGIAPRVEAAFSPSEVLLLGPSVRAADLEKIQVVLENKLVRQRLQDLGYTAEEITTRLSQLSDQEVHSIAQKLDDLKVGGDGLGIVIAVLVIIALVILIIQLSGHRVTVGR